MNIKSALLFLAVSTSIATTIPAAYAETAEGWTCKVDGKEWKEKGGATLNLGNLTLYSSDDHMEGVYIMTLMPAMVGDYALNSAAQASYTDPAGGNFKAKAESGKLVISKYTAPEGETKGKVEGTFSATVGDDPAKEHSLKDCTFSLSVRNL